MRILVISRVSIPAKDRTLPCWEHLRSLGHEVVVEHPNSVPSNQHPDAMISMGITVMEETFAAVEKFGSSVPLYCFNWDVYEWVWEPGKEGKVQAYHEIRNQGQQREYDYVRYGDLLWKARRIWVPSNCTGIRTTQWYGLQNWSVILSSCPWWDYDNVRDDGYALMCLRQIPDRHWGMFERCCERAGIPYKTPKHELSYAEYQDVVAGCRFIVAPLYELSTGGLSLMEAYYHGKPVLISDSRWNAGGEYFGNRAVYFKDGDEDDLVKKLRLIYQKPEDYWSHDGKQYITERYSDQRMVESMLRSIETTQGEASRG